MGRIGITFMGTRSLTFVVDEENHTLCQIYRQMDGYPDCHGQDLYDILRGRQLVNGFRLEDLERERPSFNGMGCLAAFLVRDLKKQIGSLYLCPPVPLEKMAEETKKHCAEWSYVIYPSNGKDWKTIRMTVYEASEKRFDGTVEEMGKKFGLRSEPPAPTKPAVTEEVAQ